MAVVIDATSSAASIPPAGNSGTTVIGKVLVSGFIGKKLIPWTEIVIE